ncbi:hypothetical protein [Natronorubrum tibetense]|uniref:Uncharacterized protein n=1 Tax=Natronorubrum tibetense GA33 TaxID=1114856 RepID=L9W0E6_9EURY|nr:hypothetical protein [Natronorubrum tibetense]ELY41793.1 hypothetical protein C496_08361 [Natronorubrum tibetense GA33]
MSERSTTADRVTAIDPSTTASRSTPVDETTACPLCAYTADSRKDVYTHLLTGHRKSAISDLLLESRSAETTR